MLIFVHIPKTGGTSVCSAFRGQRVQVERSHDSADIIRTSYSSDQWGSILKATFVRNPWDRAVSLYYWWNYHVISGLSFNAWIKDGCKHHREYAIRLGFDPLDQLPYFVDKDGNDLVDFIGRFENLQQDAVALGNLVAVKITELSHFQKSSRPDVPYQELYDAEAAEMLADHTRPFIERFKYRFDS